jgi:glycine cleavage system regulatory protein
MNKTWVLSLICEDQPGRVETLAKIISDHDGSWQESRMAHMAGKFAGIVKISVAEGRAQALQKALMSLQDMQLVIDEVKRQEDTSPQQTYSFTAIGNDRPGIVHEIAQAFAHHNINLDELHTDYTSAPHSGEALFRAQGELHVPDTVNSDLIIEQLDDIADELGIDIDIELPELS